MTGKQKPQDAEDEHIVIKERRVEKPDQSKPLTAKTEPSLTESQIMNAVADLVMQEW